MSPIAASTLSFALIFGSALAAQFVKRYLPPQHLSTESKEVVKAALELIVALTALVLGLLIAAAKSSYDAQDTAVKELSAKLILLDRTLVLYGPEAKESRTLLRETLTTLDNSLWMQEKGQSTALATGEGRGKLEEVYANAAALTPQSEVQRSLKPRILALTLELAAERLRIFAQRDCSLPTPLLVVLLAWLMILFVGYGLLAPGNATVMTMLFVCALSAAGALFMMLELTAPFAGIMRISHEPVRDALSLMIQ